MSAEESDIVVVLSFHLLRVISDERCSVHLLAASYTLLFNVKITYLFTTLFQSLSI